MVLIKEYSFGVFSVRQGKFYSKGGKKETKHKSNADDESATVQYEYFKMASALSLMECSGSVWRKMRRMKKKSS